MPTTLDHNNVVLFTDPIKLYLFKDKNKVKVSFKITDYMVTNRDFRQHDFEHILEFWNVGEGVQGIETMGDGKVWWYHSEFGPRPECVPANMVCINFSRFSFRMSVEEMERIKESYYHQKNNKMHWD